MGVVGKAARRRVVGLQWNPADLWYGERRKWNMYLSVDKIVLA